MVTISGDGNGAAGQTTSDISKVVQMMLAAKLVQGSIGDSGSNPTDIPPSVPGAPAAPTNPIMTVIPTPPAPAAPRPAPRERDDR
jgi:hypothetical protein